MDRVVHFEIQATNTDEAIEFYENSFGWRFHKWDGPQDYWLISTGEDSEPGINGGLMKTPDGQPRTGNVIDVKDVDESIGKVKERGAHIVVPKMAVPGVGYLAYFMDPQGCVFGMMQHDSTAK